MTSSVAKPQASLNWLRDWWERGWLKGLLIVAAVLLAYQPAWHGKPIWDDDAHLTPPALRTLHGLVRLWTEPGVMHQYYPLVYSIFWIEHRLWGDATLGYHLVNILLHAFSALLFWKILRRLKVPGADLAAAIFALHPVCVESVAWISELKNTLSGVFYFGSALVYLRYDRSRNRSYYILALGLFLLGLMSKTVIATLPAAVLLVFWWQRGRLSWKQDVLPLIPFFAVGIGAGLFTTWMEWKFAGARGSGFNFSIIDRALIAGRAVWFYLGKLVWPVNLTFIYPRWHVSQMIWWQYVFPVAVLLVSVGLWRLAARNRGLLVAWLFFVGTLFPASGFINVFPFRYSFVADHFQYLASLGPITLAAVGITALFNSFGRCERLLKPTFCVMLLVLLGTLSWRQSRMYTNLEILWRTTLARNPECWLAHNNLADYLFRRGHIDEAVEQYHQAIQINPNFFESLNNLGAALAAQGRFEEAIAYYRKALLAKPNFPGLLNNLGLALAKTGRFQEAIENYRRAIQINPNDCDALDNLGVAFTFEGNTDEAIKYYRRAIQIDGNRPETYFHWGMTLNQSGRIREAIGKYREALRLNPNLTGALNNLAWVLATNPDGKVRNGVEAIRLAERACNLTHHDEPMFIGTLAAAYAECGHFPEAVTTAQRAEQLATRSGLEKLAKKERQMLELYRAEKPCREAATRK